MKLLLNFIFTIFVSCPLLAANGQLAVKMGTWSFTTENIRSTSQTSSGLGAYAFEFGYALAPKWLVVFGFNLIMSELISGSAGYGFDLGGKYFPLTDACTTNIDSSSAEIMIQEKWRPYIGLFMRQRLFGLALSTSYLGPGLSLGIDYNITQSLILSGEFRYDYLYGSGNSLALQNNILLGVGMEF